MNWRIEEESVASLRMRRCCICMEEFRSGMKKCLCNEHHNIAFSKEFYGDKEVLWKQRSLGVDFLFSQTIFFDGVLVGFFFLMDGSNKKHRDTLYY